jgi:hypothetical protein
MTTAVFTLAASSQSVVPALSSAPEIRGTELAPNFRVAAFRLATSDADQAMADPRDSTATETDQHEGWIKRSVKRIGQDQKRLYLVPAEGHNIKWDIFVLVGGGTFFVFDRRIENHVSHNNFTAYQDTSNAAIYGLAAALGGVYLYGAKTQHHHARETGTLELETLVNTFLIYTPMQLIFARQRPGEGNGNGDFFKHHAINTSFPGGHAMFTFAMASVLADEYPKPWARILAYGAASTVTVTRFLARDHFASDMFVGAALGTAIAENTFHARCNPELPSQCKQHRRWWKPMKMETQ